ncbi:MAG: glycosyltransferase family 39 protein [Candidatus Kapabacteria bacterium]|nr:glycosyltransferase family 39 protein [Candidatus Kapabacteria bacterium]
MSPLRIRIVLVLVCVVFFVPFLGGARLFDWDEVNFAECAREMIVTGDYLHVQIDFRPFYEKPPLFIWLQALSMNVFGVNEFAARLPNALVGIATILVLFSIGTRIQGQRFGILWCVVYLGSLLPHFYFRSGIIDPLFNLFIFLSVLFMMKGLGREGLVNALIAGVFSGAAVMTKGPVGFGLVMITTVIGWFFLRRDVPLPWKQIVLATSTTVIVGSIWYVVEYVQNGPAFIIENLTYQFRLLTTGEAGHEQPWYYHSLILLFGCYPASIFFFGGLRATNGEDNSQRIMRIWMTVLFFVVLVVFSIVKTKIIHYSSLTYLPMTYLAALAIERWVSGNHRWPMYRTITIALLATVISAVTFIVPMALIHRDWLLTLTFFKDQFLRASIQQNISWIGVEPYIALIVLLGAIIAWYSKRVQKPLTAIGVLFGSVAVFISLYIPLVAPRVEVLTQGAALDFYESLRGKDVYVKPLTMKSYAHLFYTDKPFALSGSAKNIGADDWEPWLLNGAIDRPAFFVAKINDASPWRMHPQLRVYREVGGFVVFERVPISLQPGSQPRIH